MTDFGFAQVMQKHALRVSTALFFLAMYFLAVDNGSVAARFLGLGVRAGEVISWSEWITKRSAFVVLHGLATLVFFSLALTRNRVVATLGLAVLFVGTLFDLIYFHASERYATIGEVATLMEAFGETGGALREYHRAVFFGGLATAALFFPLLLLRRSVGSGAGPQLGVVAAGSTAVLAAAYVALAVMKGQAGLTGFPRGFSALFATCLISTVSTEPVNTGRIHLVEQPVTNVFDKIIVIMDESVTGQEFRGQFPAASKGNIYVHPGKVFSGANISAASNYFFRKSGLVRGAPTPVSSLFELAQASGYETHYIDNQGVLSDPGAKNYMDAKELAFVKHIHANRSPAKFDRDRIAFEQIRAILGRPGKAFVYLNKHGAHVPYAESIPEDKRTGSRLEDYKAAVRLNSVELLVALAGDLAENAIVIYTSDHGQNDGTGPTHGNSGEAASVAEWDVPLALLASNARFLEEVTGSPFVRSSYVSHFDIAELTRNLLGYKLRDMASVFAAASPERLETRYCARFGPPYSIIADAGGEASCRQIVLAPEANDSSRILAQQR